MSDYGHAEVSHAFWHLQEAERAMWPDEPTLHCDTIHAALDHLEAEHAALMDEMDAEGILLSDDYTVEVIANLKAENVALNKRARKLARWLPMDGIDYAASHYRSDLPEEMMSEQMTPEDWLTAAHQAVKEDNNE